MALVSIRDLRGKMMCTYGATKGGFQRCRDTSQSTFIYPLLINVLESRRADVNQSKANAPARVEQPSFWWNASSA